ncbi:hypothetical protein PM082_002336 [Marasmius tenuissimus]|nr:hypothetical protein PM082_002336 [Marasmius tenuissimus]
MSLRRITTLPLWEAVKQLWQTRTPFSGYIGCKCDDSGVSSTMKSPRSATYRDKVGGCGHADATQMNVSILRERPKMTDLVGQRVSIRTVYLTNSIFKQGWAAGVSIHFKAFWMSLPASLNISHFYCCPTPSRASRYVRCIHICPPRIGLIQHIAVRAASIDGSLISLGRCGSLWKKNLSRSVRLGQTYKISSKMRRTWNYELSVSTWRERSVHAPIASVQSGAGSLTASTMHGRSL